jgi:hypothetical protein
MDFLSASTEGIRNTTTVFDQDDIDRVRMPRFIASDGVLRASLFEPVYGIGLIRSSRFRLERHWVNLG